ncbi:MAG: cytochrome c oxidase subunit II [Dehalococcoidia bacterium]|nr:cytochrome c oxidase subunit II [Dehalococcoidia bacterium]
MRRDILIVATLWTILTALGLLLVNSVEFFPQAAAREAKVADDAFRTLTLLAVPVFMFVAVTLLYSIFRFRSKGEPTTGGPQVHTNKTVVATWLIITSALTVLVIIHPGITGMMEIFADAAEKPDLVVQVEGYSFGWQVTYPSDGNATTGKEMVLPINKHVRFDITARDVLHGFWVPAFRVKIDAVPGLVTQAYATPNRIGSTNTDDTIRLQCTQLCGAGHGLMSIPVRIVEQKDFEAWVAQQQKKQ